MMTAIEAKERTELVNDAVARLHVSEVMRRYDFNKVHRVMQMLDWKWHNSDGTYAVPTLQQLQGNAEKLILHVCKHYISDMMLRSFGPDGYQTRTLSSGGFSATLRLFDDGDTEVELRFEVESADSRLYDE